MKPKNHPHLPPHLHGIVPAFVLGFLLAALARGPASAEDTPIGADFSAWREPVGEWFVALDVAPSAEDPKKLSAKEGRGVIVNGKGGVTRDLLTRAEYGDVEVHLEFLVPKGSNSGVYFMGRYEIQVYDSFDAKELHTYDCGSIYERWDGARGQGREGYEGRTAMANASKAPGEWQTFDVLFRAPRFDAAGKKTENARFVKVVHNGVLIHENEEITGPTRASPYEGKPEATLGPILLQGDHGPVAYRAIRIRSLPDAAAGAPAYRREAMDETGFVSIFDGKTLAGWHVSAKTGHSATSKHQSGGRWVVEDGAIVGSQDVPGNGGICITDGAWGDFEVVLEMRNDFGPDSGLFLRSTEEGAAYQYLVDYHDAGNLAGLYGENMRRGFHTRNFNFRGDPAKIEGVKADFPLPVKPEEWTRVWKPGEWNELRARIEGNPPRITTWINRVRFMEFQDTEKRHGETGGIAVQVHGGGDLTKQSVRYRKVRVKDLSPKK